MHTHKHMYIINGRARIIIDRAIFVEDCIAKLSELCRHICMCKTSIKTNNTYMHHSICRCENSGQIISISVLPVW